MKIEFEISEERIIGEVARYIADELLESLRNDGGYGSCRYEIKKAISEALRKSVYQNKDAVIDKAVNKAAAEIVRKSNKLLIAKLLTPEKPDGE